MSTQLPQYQTSVLGPGIAGLFIQGIEAGLVFAQFSQWFYRSDRREGSLLSTIIVFVTVIGLAQSGLCFASAWSKYVLQFGAFPLADWKDYVQPIISLVISVPVQALMIRRCYYLMGKNMFIVALLVLLLVASTTMTLWAAISIIKFVASIQTRGPVTSPPKTDISWPFLVSVLLPSVLDLTLTAILLHYLIRTMKQVYAAQARKKISRLVNIVWQSALPPTLCAICVTVLYIQYTTVPQSEMPFWFPVIQAMIGKLYVLSLLYTVNAQPLQPSEQPTTFISTFTIPAEVMYTRTQDAQGRDIARSENVEEHGQASKVTFAA
ncbi:hypothetical protein H4582DRAFT_620317 [Lactarius indigo]|nr:hypothetical protein H4582DRAFT_620317 [Lactarius indigo]